MALNTKIVASIVAVLTGSGDHATPRAEPQFIESIELLTGTGASQADKVFSDQRTLTASATEDLDLAGVLTDLLGATITFAKIKAILIKASPANTNDVIVGGGTNGWFGCFSDLSDKIVIKPGGFFLWAAPVSGVAVTAGTVDILKVANSAGSTSVVFDIIIIGTSA